MSLSHAAYARLLAMRTGLRHFERWSEQQAAKAGLTAAQHQLILAVRGHSDPRGPTIGEVADYLLLRHHSAVGLVDRADAAGFLRRVRDPDDRRVVRLRLTPDGARRLERLSALHVEELERLASQIGDAWEGLSSVNSVHGFERIVSTGEAPAEHEEARPSVEVARVYDDLARQKGRKVLVDRLWPRGLKKEGAGIDDWMKDVAPSAELRRWYNHVPERFEQFSKRYRAELASSPGKEALEVLGIWAKQGGVTLLTATKDLELSQAAVLAEILSES